MIVEKIFFLWIIYLKTVENYINFTKKWQKSAFKKLHKTKKYNFCNEYVGYYAKKWKIYIIYGKTNAIGMLVRVS